MLLDNSIHSKLVLSIKVTEHIMSICGSVLPVNVKHWLSIRGRVWQPFRVLDVLIVEQVIMLMISLMRVNRVPTRNCLVMLANVGLVPRQAKNARLVWVIKKEAVGMLLKLKIKSTLVVLTIMRWLKMIMAIKILIPTMPLLFHSQWPLVVKPN